MKKLMLVAFAGILSVYGVNAQSQNNKEGKKMEHAHKKGMKWQKENLTPEQRQKAKAEKEQFKAQREEIKNNPNLSELQKKERMRELSQEERNRLNGILSPEQRGKFKAYKSDSTKNRRTNMSGLDLSQSQKEKMNQIRENYRNEGKKIRENSALSDEQKKAKFQELRQQQHKEMNKVLNKEQKEKMKNWGKQKRGTRKVNG